MRVVGGMCDVWKILDKWKVHSVMKPHSFTIDISVSVIKKKRFCSL